MTILSKEEIENIRKFAGHAKIKAPDSKLIKQLCNLIDTIAGRDRQIGELREKLDKTVKGLPSILKDPWLSHNHRVAIQKLLKGLEDE